MKIPDYDLSAGLADTDLFVTDKAGVTKRLTGAQLKTFIRASSTKRITGANFTDATHYNNTDIAGKTVLVFMNGINRYLELNEYTYTSTGIDITLPGFSSVGYTDTIIVTVIS